MDNIKLFVKNMVCDRCIMAVKDSLAKVGLTASDVTLGEVTFAEHPDKEKVVQLSANLNQLGFEIIEDKTARIVSSIKTAILDYIRSESSRQKALKFSAYLADRLNKDYSYLSHLFSEIEGTTIEQYVIHQKIERVKELLVYDELSLSEIADDLGYSSVQHLSNQFKKVTGLTPSHFKTIKENKRTPLDKV